MRNYIAAGIIMIACSCTSTDKKVSTAQSDSTLNAEVAPQASVELADVKAQNIYNGYIVLKDALVATQFEDAKKAAADLKLSLAVYKGCEPTALIADKIANAQEIATQRKEFTALSSDVIAMFKHAALKKGSIYIQHCPMANKGAGGDWLASEKKIQNPYYGDEMMECGAVVEEINTKK